MPLSERASKILGYCAAGVSLCSFGISSPAFKKIEISPFVRVAWRLQISLVFLILPAILLIARSSKDVKSRLLSFQTVFGVACTACTSLVTYTTLNLALSSTMFVHAMLISQSHPLILVALRTLWSVRGLRLRILAMKHSIVSVVASWLRMQPLDPYDSSAYLRPSTGEFVGVLVGFTGLIISEMDSGSASENDLPVSLAGDAIAFLSAFSFTVYMLILKSFCGWMQPVVFLTVNNLVNMLLVAIVFPLALSSPWTSSSMAGLLDWPFSPYLFPWVLIVGVVAGVFAQLSTTIALQRLPPVHLSLILTQMPVLATVLAWVIGVGGVPTVWTVVGACVAIVGIITVVWSGRTRPARKDTAKPLEYLVMEEVGDVASPNDDRGGGSDSGSGDGEVEVSVVVPVEGDGEAQDRMGGAVRTEAGKRST